MGCFDFAKISPRLFGEGDMLSHPRRFRVRQRCFAHSLPVVQRQAEVGEHVFERDRGIVPAPLDGFGDRVALLIGERLVISRRQREFA
jgi:hypothetical protein